MNQVEWSHLYGVCSAIFHPLNGDQWLTFVHTINLTFGYRLGSVLRSYRLYFIYFFEVSASFQILKEVNWRYVRILSRILFAKKWNDFNSEAFSIQSYLSFFSMFMSFLLSQMSLNDVKIKSYTNIEYITLNLKAGANVFTICFDSIVILSRKSIQMFHFVYEFKTINRRSPSKSTQFYFYSSFFAAFIANKLYKNVEMRNE